MDMKKVSCAIIVAAASMSVVMAAGAASAPTPLADGLAPSAAVGSASAPAPGSSGAAAALPVLGSLVGASIVSLLSYVLQ
ncbi:hypothetical protein F3Y22_tig00111941pilonHSYRG00093 [Hibiscus syriacus]|uniref:Arabinogalactan peptide 23-like n=1 Tax=Hibiscus syriacus TaxID=106335 RepID=A0A6A2X8V1_HIBSY|nr:hypothetical protein F3Y22_tig00111941pilonHSYRG00093 [Hibiscus syriacus]